MSIFDRFRKETRAAVDPSWDAVKSEYGLNRYAAQHAENLSTVLACTQAISSAIASLPAYVYIKQQAGRQVDNAHPMMHLVTDGVNDNQAWPDFIEWLMSSVLLRGNGLAEIVTDSSGSVVELIPIPWEDANPQLLSTGRLVFDIQDKNGYRRLLNDDVLHVTDRTDDGLIGRSRLQRARSVVDTSLQIQNYTQSMFENQATPSGVIEADGKINADAMDSLKKQFNDAYSGAANARKAMVLDQGLHFKPISLSAEDSELLSSRRFSVEEIARIYSVPPPVIGDLSHGTFTNAETSGRWFAQHTLTPWIRKLEAQIARSVFTAASRRTRLFEFDMSSFMRGDPEQRWASHKIAVESGVLTVDEIREIEGYAPRGDSNGG